MVSLKLDKYKLWGLITVGVTWVLYMVAVGTAWYQIRKTPNTNANAGDELSYTIKMGIMSLVYDQSDSYGNTRHDSRAWGAWDLVWTRSVLSGAYAFGALCFIFQTIILVVLLLTILDKGSEMMGKLMKGFAIALIIFHTLAIIIFPGITIAFKKDQDHAAGHNPNKKFWPCTSTCDTSFVGIQNDGDNNYIWAPDAGWAVMVFGWPIMIAAAWLLIKKIGSEGSSKPSGGNANANKGVTIELPQSN